MEEAAVNRGAKGVFWWKKPRREKEQDIEDNDNTPTQETRFWADDVVVEPSKFDSGISDFVTPQRSFTVLSTTSCASSTLPPSYRSEAGSPPYTTGINFNHEYGNSDEQAQIQLIDSLFRLWLERDRSTEKARSGYGLSDEHLRILRAIRLILDSTIDDEMAGVEDKSKFIHLKYLERNKHFVFNKAIQDQVERFIASTQRPSFEASRPVSYVESVASDVEDVNDEETTETTLTIETAQPIDQEKSLPMVEAFATSDIAVRQPIPRQTQLNIQLNNIITETMAIEVFVPTAVASPFEPVAFIPDEPLELSADPEASPLHKAIERNSLASFIKLVNDGHSVFKDRFYLDYTSSAVQFAVQLGRRRIIRWLVHNIPTAAYAMLAEARFLDEHTLAHYISFEDNERQTLAFLRQIPDVLRYSEVDQDTLDVGSRPSTVEVRPINTTSEEPVIDIRSPGPWVTAAVILGQPSPTLNGSDGEEDEVPSLGIGQESEQPHGTSSPPLSAPCSDVFMTEDSEKSNSTANTLLRVPTNQLAFHHSECGACPPPSPLVNMIKPFYSENPETTSHSEPTDALSLSTIELPEEYGLSDKVFYDEEEEEVMERIEAVYTFLFILVLVEIKLQRMKTAFGYGQENGCVATGDLSDSGNGSGGRNGSGSSSSGSSSQSSASHTPVKPTNLKRGFSDMKGEDQNDDDDDPDLPKNKRPVSRSKLDPENKQFTCPYGKGDSNKHARCLEIHRQKLTGIKEHLKRSHFKIPKGSKEDIPSEMRFAKTWDELFIVCNPGWVGDLPSPYYNPMVFFTQQLQYAPVAGNLVIPAGLVSTDIKQTPPAEKRESQNNQDAYFEACPPNQSNISVSPASNADPHTLYNGRRLPGEADTIASRMVAAFSRPEIKSCIQEITGPDIGIDAPGSPNIDAEEMSEFIHERMNICVDQPLDDQTEQLMESLFESAFDVLANSGWSISQMAAGVEVSNHSPFIPPSNADSLQPPGQQNHETPSPTGSDGSSAVYSLHMPSEDESENGAANTRYKTQFLSPSREENVYGPGAMPASPHSVHSQPQATSETPLSGTGGSRNSHSSPISPISQTLPSPVIPSVLITTDEVLETSPMISSNPSPVQTRSRRLDKGKSKALQKKQARYTARVKRPREFLNQYKGAETSSAKVFSFDSADDFIDGFDDWMSRMFFDPPFCWGDWEIVEANSKERYSDVDDLGNDIIFGFDEFDKSTVALYLVSVH